MSSEQSLKIHGSESQYAFGGNGSSSLWDQHSKAASRAVSPQNESEKNGHTYEKNGKDDENERMFEFHQKRLHRKEARRPLSQRPASRSMSHINNYHETPALSSVGGADMVSQLRFRSIITNARHTMSQHSFAMGSCRTPSMALTEGERFALEKMLDREERRNNALHRVADDDRRRDKILLSQEIARESATLERLLRMEEKKVETAKERQERRISRMEQAKQRRAAMDRERRERLELMHQERERRHSQRDPYAMLVMRAKYRSRSSCAGA